MSFVNRIFRRADAPARTEPPVTVAAPETRAQVEPSWAALAGGAADWTTLKGGAPVALTPRLAENAAMVLAAVNAISSAVASLPAYVFRLLPNGRDVDERHALARLIAEGPNADQSWPDFIEMLVAQTLLHGNALVEIIADALGAVASMRVVPWPHVTVVLLPSGRLAYDISEISSLYGGTGRTRRLLDTEVIHLRDRSDDGLVGRSRLSRCAAPIRLGLTQGAFAETLFDNQATPSGVVSTDQRLTPEQRGDLQTAVRDTYVGVRNAGGVMVLHGGMRFDAITISPEDAELLSSRKFSAEEIARIFNVPPPIVGDYSHNTFTNSAAAGRWFAQFTLAPWIRKIEEAFTRALLSPVSGVRRRLEIDLSGFLRGDAEARWAAHEIAVRNNILDPDEIREVEGWNPRAESVSNQAAIEGETPPLDDKSERGDG